MADDNRLKKQSAYKPDRSSDCNVAENRFPQMGQCCCRSADSVQETYDAICTFCDIWTSPPDSGNLEVATIFECNCHGYGKRIKE